MLFNTIVYINVDIVTISYIWTELSVEVGLVKFAFSLLQLGLVKVGCFNHLFQLNISTVFLLLPTNLDSFITHSCLFQALRNLLSLQHLSILICNSYTPLQTLHTPSEICTSPPGWKSLPATAHIQLNLSFPTPLFRLEIRSWSPAAPSLTRGWWRCTFVHDRKRSSGSLRSCFGRSPGFAT